MLIKTYSLRPHCVSCWTAYILQDDTRSLQCQHLKFVDKFVPDLNFLRPVLEAPDLRLHPQAVYSECVFLFSSLVIPGKCQNITMTGSVHTFFDYVMKSELSAASVIRELTFPKILRLLNRK